MIEPCAKRLPRPAAALAAALAAGSLLIAGSPPAAADPGPSADRVPADIFVRVRATAREGDVLLRMRGGLRLPGAAYGRRNCVGTVRIVVRQSGIRLGGAKARVDGACNFRRTIRLAGEQHPECGRDVRVKARFLGNRRVAPDSTRRSVRVC